MARSSVLPWAAVDRPVTPAAEPGAGGGIRAEDTEVGWHSAFDGPLGVGWIYVAALRRFTVRLLAGLSRRLRDRATFAP